MSTEKTQDIKFGTDGWRGVMAREFTFDNVRRVAQAIADYVKDETEKSPKRKPPFPGPVLVGYDRRFLSDAFAREIAQVLEANRMRPVLLEESLPTPAISFLTRKLKGLGVMVTASHNPPSYNGIKIKLDGRAVMPNVTTAVEAMLDKNQPSRSNEYKHKNFRRDYLSYLRSRADGKRIAAKLKRPVIVDYLHGAAAGLLEELVVSKRLLALHSKHDPLFGGVNPEPIEANLKELSAKVRESKALIGIALDGDADRIGLVDDTGRYLTPCQVFPLIIRYLVERKKLRGKIVQSVSLGYVSARMAKAFGLDFEEMPVGFKHVAEALNRGEAAIAGEESGGYAWKGGLPERDGLVTALLLLEMCVTLGKAPSQLWKEIEEKYGKSVFKRVDYKLNKPLPDKSAFAAKLAKRLPKRILGTPIKQLIQIDGLKIILEGDHWLLLRPSGTEPLLRVYAESDSEKRTAELLQIAAKWAPVSH
ncbi:MAG: phosphoglucomutase/phosphomannomutase family protein [Elusimicrobia bacterium]|nr:phosphoglucomutase/phosphomannomutase family protein [Elusimicrobiota bacterium]MDE2236763.1 phosphoglucomutase/phosphomannomutase family protein [Elusimicrobiota bacterium]MDE2427022.1 phosphoglucomutase/phosphomannomutase family protein [Elusimicrobiota bacterium]